MDELDGNAVAGLWTELMAADPTMARAACAGCGQASLVGALAAYVTGMGAILRCRSCDTAMIRIGRAPGRGWVDLRGISVLEIATA
jgi:hypothetical protein